MKQTTEKFLKLFFNPGETICFSPNKYAYPSKNQEEINEKSTVLVAINPINGQRNDENVTAYRTFMIECDEGSINSQWDYIKESEFPFSYCCFSGNKSLHFALVLEEEIPGFHIYRYTYEWILNILQKADQKTKNPSRSIRFFGVTRPETNKEQKLVYMGSRIGIDKFSEWLHKHEHKRPTVNLRTKERADTATFEGIKKWVIRDLCEGVHRLEGSRNQRWMAIGCELALNGYDLDSTIIYLQNFFEEQSDFREKEWLAAVRSGWNYADKITRRDNYDKKK